MQPAGHHLIPTPCWFSAAIQSCLYDNCCLGLVETAVGISSSIQPFWATQISFIILKLNGLDFLFTCWEVANVRYRH